MGRVGCRPVRRNWLLSIVGWAGSSMTGPAPVAGGLSPPRMATQPTLEFGEKAGGDSALSAGETAAPISNTPKVPDNKEKLDIGPSPALARRGLSGEASLRARTKNA